MAEIDLEDDLAETAKETIRVPRNIMGLLRQSYDSREKMLDWILAIGVTLAIAWAFRDQLGAFWNPDAGPNAGRDDNVQPNQDVPNAFPTRTGRDIYTYNMPPARTIRYDIGPSGTIPPGNPASAPGYP